MRATCRERTEKRPSNHTHKRARTLLTMSHYLVTLLTMSPQIFTTLEMLKAFLSNTKLYKKHAPIVTLVVKQNSSFLDTIPFRGAFPFLTGVRFDDCAAVSRGQLGQTADVLNRSCLRLNTHNTFQQNVSVVYLIANWSATRFFPFDLREATRER